MTARQRTIRHLVAANRILAHEGIVDAYGHVSARNPEHPDRFLLSVSRAPEQVEEDDIVEFELDGSPVDPDGRPLYLERFIHAGLYEVRPDAAAALHAHTESVLPFTIGSTPLRAVIEAAAAIGSEVPVWDSRARFGGGLLVTDLDRGRDLAASLGDGTVALMRGHGFAAVGPALPLLVRIAVALARNARVQTLAMSMGDYTALSGEEIAAHSIGPVFEADSPAMLRSWEHLVARAGCSHLLSD